MARSEQRADERWQAERAAILTAIEAGAEATLALARWMAAHPELSLEERETSEHYAAHLEARGFRVERGVAEERGLHLGHACGHNLSGPASLLAAEAVAKVLGPTDLRLLVVGSPAEEIGVGKLRLVEAGVFGEADVAMMAHASDMRRAHRLFLGNRKREFVYHGRAAHAAAYPERGINALDGVIALFVAVGMLRQQLATSVRIHGIVSDGGRAPNIIPERAAARFWIRALDEALLDDALDRVIRCAEGAAAATGTRLEMREEPGQSPPMRPNLPLADAYRSQLEWLGLAETPQAPGEAIGSSDITHVSQVVPTIHPNFPIGRDLQLHTRAFAAAT
ncbi:MAG TPA: M20/M25/M40 family metallo-hydrolase, partial [Myxococcota bacterium]